MSQDRLSEIEVAKAKALSDLKALETEEKKLRDAQMAPLREATVFIQSITNGRPFYFNYNDASIVARRMEDNIGIEELNRLIAASKKLSAELIRAVQY